MAAPLVEMRDVSIAFGGVKAVDHVSVDLYPGEVVGLLGHNGAGKSTLIKILSGAYPKDSGEILINGQPVEINNPRDARALNIETIYQTLALADNLDAASNLFLGRELTTALGFVDDDAMEAETRRIMGRLNPNFQKFKDPVKALSGGERNRLLLARLFTRQFNLLVLDEPTNDLDAETLELLEEQLINYQGTLLLVSHDRAFIDNVVTQLWVFEGEGQIDQQVGGYSDWLARKGSPSSGKKTQTKKPGAPKIETGAAAEPVSQKAPEPSATPKKKLSYKLQRELDNLPDEIAKAEAERDRLTAVTTAADFYSGDQDTIQKALAELAAIEEQLDELETRWLELEEMTGE